jgi:hypothetical protein
VASTVKLLLSLRGAKRRGNPFSLFVDIFIYEPFSNGSTDCHIQSADWIRNDVRGRNTLP